MKKLLILFVCLSSLTAGSINKEEITSYFDDVLLVINFNHPYYGNIEFLNEIYGPYFKNIVYYGETPHPEVHSLNHSQGWFFHRVVKDVVERYPDYKGYIFCQDDCFMNFSNFLRLDKERIWFHQYWSASLAEPKSPWPWWNYPIGYKAIKSAVRKLPKANREMLFKNCKFYHVPVAWADFFYIPNHLAKKAINICSHFDSPNVFLEIGIPTILLSIDSCENIEYLNPNWGGTIQSVDLSQFDGCYDWIHPIKFSDPKNRSFIQSLELFRKS